MKLKFRRGKPPLQIHEKGEPKHTSTRKTKKVFMVVKKQEDPAVTPKVIVLVEKKPSRSFINGQPVIIKIGEHTGETAVVIGPSKTLPGRLGVLTLGGLVHYKPEDLEVQK